MACQKRQRTEELILCELSSEGVEVLDGIDLQDWVNGPRDRRVEIGDNMLLEKVQNVDLCVCLGDSELGTCVKYGM